MKRLFALLLVLTLLLCGCAKKPADTPDPSGTSEPTTPTQETTQSTQAPTDKPTDAPTQAPTNPPVLNYRNPLTGEKIAEPWSGQMVAVMVNNIKDSMPQYGLSQADIIYEIQEEGYITRNMAIYSDVSKVGTVGSIRSTRSYFVSVAASYDAYLVHCGTSTHARGGGYDSTGKKIADWKDFDQFYNANYFFRDYDRYDKGYAWEHTLFTSGEQLAKGLSGKSQSTAKDYFTFKEGVELPKSETANEVTVTFKGGKTTTFTYDAATGLYTRSQYGGETVDAANNQTVKVKNVLALYTNQKGSCNCSYGGHQFYDTIGSGEGYAAVNGKIVAIKWSRASVNDPYVYTLSDGSALELDVGSTYIAVVGIKHPISYK